MAFVMGGNADLEAPAPAPTAEGMNVGFVGEHSNAAAQHAQDDEELCIACQDLKRNVRLPCGHGVLCEPCTKRLLEGPTRPTCPTCREPFTEYYVMDGSTLHRTSSYVSPDLQASFGNLRRASLHQLASFHNRPAGQRPPSGCALVCALLGLILILGLGCLPFVLGGLELSYGTRGRAWQCASPLSDWLVTQGCLHLGLPVVEILLAVCARDWYRRHKATISGMNRNVLLFLLGYGAVSVYSIPRSQCPNVMYDYGWWYCTISLSICGVAVFCLCLACFFRVRGRA